VALLVAPRGAAHQLAARGGGGVHFIGAQIVAGAVADVGAAAGALGGGEDGITAQVTASAVRVGEVAPLGIEKTLVALSITVIVQAVADLADAASVGSRATGCR